MTLPETTPEPANCPYCPYCPHPAHRPGVECESIVEHSPERWHRCLCLNLVAADAPCPPQMDCQGGMLGYSEAWHLVRGRGPHATPEPADRAALRDQIAAALYERATPGCRWADLHPDDRVALWDDADAVLAVLPAPADRAAVLREAIERLETRTRQAPAPGWRAHSFTDVRDTLVDDLRRLADESQQPTSVPATCPAPASRQSEWCAAADALDEGTARFIAEWPDERQSPYMQGRRDAAASLRTLADEAGQPGKQRCTCGGWFPISHIRADTHSPAADEAQQPDQFTEAERGFLAYALHLADEQMATGGGKFSDEDRAALVTFQRPAKAGCTCDPIGESWVEMPHAADCPMTEGAQR